MSVSDRLHEKAECDECDDTGLVQITVAECCGYGRESGQCCGSPVPVPELVPCGRCPAGEEVSR